MKLINYGALCAALIALTPAAARAQASNPINTPIALKGQLVGKPGEDVHLSVVGPTAIDASGNVAALATVSGTSVKKGAASGIAVFTGSSVNLVAKIGHADPVTGGTFAKLSDPVVSAGGALAFVGTLKTGGSISSTSDTAVYVYQNGTLSIAAYEGEPITSGSYSGKFTAFNQIGLNNAGGVTLFAGVKYTGGTTNGLFATDQSGVLRMLVAKGHGGDHLAKSFSGFVPLPFVSGQSRTLDTVNGNLVIVGQLDPPTPSSIGLATCTATDFNEQILADTSGTVPNLQGTVVKSFGEPIVNANASVAFAAALSGSNVNGTNNAGIGLITQSFQGIAVRTSDIVPDTAGNPSGLILKKVSAPVLNNNDAIAFIGTVKTGGTNATGSSDTGVWSNWDGTYKLVIREGDPAPDGNGGLLGKFSVFKQLVLPDVGGPIFLATLSGVPGNANTGVWAIAPDGSVKLIVKTGGSLDFNGASKVVKSINIFQLAPISLGQSRSFDASTGNLAYQANFTDGTWGIYRVSWQ